ncbi:MAG: hypothetical protein HY748_04500 [Elusimicrobia bacterium]|nr:hypothetical protein [Elusimicrobiota bacterium]
MRRQEPACERPFDPYRLDGVGFVVVMAAVVFLGRENPNFFYPQILWVFAALLLFNLLTISLLLPGDLGGTRRMALSVGANLGLMSAVVEFSGGRESYLWIAYLLPVFHGCVFFAWRGSVAVTAAAVVLLALPYTAYFQARLWGGLVELLVKALTILLAAAVMGRIARQERLSRSRLSAEQRKIQREREAARVQLQHMDRLATLGTLTASVAHEINSPLASILGHAQLALRGPFSEKEARDALCKIEVGVLRGKSTIQNMLSFSRRSASTRRPALFVTDLRMPGLSALEFFRTLEDKGMLRDLRVLVVSGSPPGSALKSLLDSRGLRQLHKPCDIKVLEDEVSSLLGKTQGGRKGPH